MIERAKGRQPQTVLIPEATSHAPILTDSGYGSKQDTGETLKPVDETGQLLEGIAGGQKAPISPDATDDVEAQTEYSAATTVMPQKMQTYLSELSADMYNKIRHHVDARSWPFLCNALPGLTKAFAVKLGQGDLRMNRVIMHFIHRHHR
jgi:hypothetical protein